MAFAEFGELFCAPAEGHQLHEENPENADEAKGKSVWLSHGRYEGLVGMK